jgi:type I restriction enzyme S subunit
VTLLDLEDLEGLPEGAVLGTELPDGWLLCRMGDVAELIGGGTPKSSDQSNFGADHPWITPADLSGFEGIYIADGARRLSEKGLNESSARLVPKGSVLFSSRAPIGYVAIAANELATNQGFKTFLCRTGIVPEYVFQYLRFAKPLAERMASGTTFLEISGGRCKEIPIPLPPTAEQKRIAAKVEAVLAKANAARQRLAKVQAILKRFRQSVLAAACSGRLTEDWREALPADETGTALLNSLKSARVEVGTRRLPTADEDAQEAEAQADLPASWAWTSIGECFQVCVGGTPSRKEPRYWNGNVAWVSSGEVNFCRITTTSETITELGLENSNTKLHPPGTVLIGMIGEGKTRGQAAILDIPACNNQNAAAIRVSVTPIPPEFVYYWLASQYETTRGRGAGNSQPALNKQRVERISFPLPPLPEQDEIVRRVSALFALADKIEARLAAATAAVNRITQSVLAKAFRGELVETEASLARREGRDYEPAAKLLERVRAAAATEPSAQKGKSKLRAPRRTPARA